MCLARYGIPHISAFPACQAGFISCYCLTYKTYQQFVGIGTSLINLQSGMSSTKTFQIHSNSDITFFRSNFLIFKRSSYIHTTGTANIKFTFIFRIKIKQYFAIHRTRF